MPSLALEVALPCLKPASNFFVVERADRIKARLDLGARGTGF